MSIGTAKNSFACYGCIDWANNARTLAYYKWACSQGMFPSGGEPIIDNICACPADDGDWSDPETDNVCWFDANVPESNQFLGIVILSVAGSRNSTFSREVQDGMLEGSVLQRPRLRGRSFGFDVLLLATSCEGMEYGEEWFRRLLEDAQCASQNACSSCMGKELTLRIMCPDGATDDGLHVWQSTGLVDGLTIVDADYKQKASCCTIRHATFTMQSESPYSYSVDPVTSVFEEASVDTYTRCFDWEVDCLDCEEDCCDKCGFDALCTCYTPPKIVPVLVDDSCFCEPLARVIQAGCINDPPGGYDTAFKIDVYSGTDFSNDQYKTIGLRNLRIRIYDNVLGLDCITDDDTYDIWCDRQASCAELMVAYVPEDSTLTIDGRTGRITLNCNGICRPYEHVVTASTGRVFPLITRCAPMMITAEFDYYNTQLLPASPGVKPASVTIDNYLRFRG